MGMPTSLKPAVRLVSSLHAIRKKREQRSGVVPTENPDGIASITSGNAENSRRSVPHPHKPKDAAKEERKGNINARDGPVEEKEDPEVSVADIVQFEQEEERSLR